MLVDRAPQFDIAQELGLGALQGGIEVGSYAGARPRPSGLVSALGPTADDLGSLITFGAIPKANLTDIGVAGVRPFDIVLGDVNYPSAAGNMNQGTNTGLSFAQCS